MVTMLNPGLQSRVCLNDPHHHGEFVQCVSSFLKREAFLDLVFICDQNVEVKAHKLVFACISEFLKQLIEVVASEVVYINLPNVDHKKLLLLVDFLYGGIRGVNQEELSSIKEILSLLCIHIPNAVIMTVAASNAIEAAAKPQLPFLNPNLRIVPIDPPASSTFSLNGQFLGPGSTAVTGSTSQIHGFPVQPYACQTQQISPVPHSYSCLEPIRIKQEVIDSDETAAIEDVPPTQEEDRTIRPVTTDNRISTPAKDTTEPSKSSSVGTDNLRPEIHGFPVQTFPKSVTVQLQNIKDTLLKEAPTKPKTRFSKASTSTVSQNDTSETKPDTSSLQVDTVKPVPVPRINSPKPQVITRASARPTPSPSPQASARPAPSPSPLLNTRTQQNSGSPQPAVSSVSDVPVPKPSPMKTRKSVASSVIETKSSTPPTEPASKPVQPTENNRRTRFTEEQVRIMEEKFLEEKFPDSDYLEVTAEKFGCPPTSVKRWFSHRREKEKRDKKQAVGKEKMADLSEEQSQILETKYYPVNKNPSAEIIKSIAAEFICPVFFVDRWFKQRREKDEKAGAAAVVSVSPPQLRSSRRIATSTPNSSTTSRSVSSSSSTPESGAVSAVVKQELQNAEGSKAQNVSLDGDLLNESGTVKEDSSSYVEMKDTLEQRDITGDLVEDSANKSEDFISVQGPSKANSSSDNSTAKPRRHMFNESQLVVLEAVYKKSKSPPPETCASLSDELGFPITSIKRWFRYRRDKEKKELAKKKIKNENREERFAVLQAHYKKNKYPSEDFIESICKRFGVTPTYVKKWFYNRRVKVRQEGVTRTSETQREALQLAFRENNFPDRETMMKLAKDQHLPLKFVMRWFVDKRVRDRKGNMNRAASLLKSSVSLARGKKVLKVAIGGNKAVTPVKHRVANGVGYLARKGSPTKSSCSSPPKAAKKATPWNAEQLAILEEHFKANKYPDSEIVEEISSQLKAGPLRVRLWFKRRRKRERDGGVKLVVCRNKKSDKTAVDTTSQRKKVVTNDYQKEVLEYTYKKHKKFPSLDVRNLLSRELGLPLSIVSNWFQNKRARDRKEVAAVSPKKGPKTIDAFIKEARESRPSTVTKSPAKTQEGTTVAQSLGNASQDGPQGRKRKISLASEDEAAAKRHKKFTDSEIEILEAEFKESPYPDFETYNRIATTLGAQHDTVRSWFIKRRKSQRESDSSPQVIKVVQKPAESPAAKKLKRTVYSEWQRHVLEKEFRRNSYPSNEVQEKIASELKMNSRAVVIWFRNRRKRGYKGITSQNNPGTSNSAVQSTSVSEVDLSVESDEDSRSVPSQQKTKEKVPSSETKARASRSQQDASIKENGHKRSPSLEKDSASCSSFTLSISQQNVFEELYQSDGVPNKVMMHTLKKELDLPNISIIEEWFQERISKDGLDPEPFKCTWEGCVLKFPTIDLLEQHFMTHSKSVRNLKEV